MAEKPKKIEEQKQDQEVQEREQEPKTKKGLPINIIISVILAFCLIGGGLFVWKAGLISKFSGKKAKAQTEKADASASNEIGAIYELETFIVNLAGGAGNNYLKVKINLEMDKATLKDEIDKRLPQFRDSILTLLSGKTYQEVKTLEGKSQIRIEIITMLNQYLKTGKVTNIYFGDFIVQ